MPDNWTLTDQAAIILKSYGCDDMEAARAVVALVLEEAEIWAQYHFSSNMHGTYIKGTIRAMGEQS